MGERKSKVTVRQQKKAMLTALKSALGIVSSAVDTVGIARSTHYRWMQDDPKYKAAVDEIEDTAIDFAETSLLKQIKAENTSATIFYLKTKGKKRGYIETTININRDVADLSDLTDAELLIIEQKGHAGLKEVTENRKG